jgi:hypothetical protein
VIPVSERSVSAALPHDENRFALAHSIAVLRLFARIAMA